MMLAKLVLAGSFAVLAFAAPVAEECSGTYCQDNGYCHGISPPLRCGATPTPPSPSDSLLPSGLVWLGGKPNDLQATWAAIKATGLKGVIVDIGVSTSDITALQHAGAVVVLAVSNSVKDWNAPYWNARSDWSAKIKMTNAVALDTEYATDEDCDQIFSQQGFISAFKDVKSLLYAVDNETCEKKFRSMASMGWTNLRSVGDAYSTGNLRHINPCTDVVQTIVAAGAGIPEKSVDPVKNTLAMQHASPTH